MPNMINLVILIVFSILIDSSTSLKILIAGSFEPTEHRYFESVARYLVRSETDNILGNNHTVYQLWNTPKSKKPFEIQ